MFFSESSHHAEYLDIQQPYVLVDSLLVKAVFDDVITLGDHRSRPKWSKVASLKNQ